MINAGKINFSDESVAVSPKNFALSRFIYSTIPPIQNDDFALVSFGGGGKKRYSTSTTRFFIV